MTDDADLDLTEPERCRTTSREATASMGRMPSDPIQLFRPDYRAVQPEPSLLAAHANHAAMRRGPRPSWSGIGSAMRRAYAAASPP